MNFLITAAGAGSRFRKAKIKPPKPLIKVLGQELLLWSLDSFELSNDDKLFILTLSSDNVKKRLEKKIRLKYSIEIFWLEINHMTNGQLESAALLIEHFKISGPILIHNCDTSYSYKLSRCEEILSSNSDCFGIIPCFSAAGDHWSFVKTESPECNVAVQVTEKNRISDNCSVGSYLFASADEFIDLLCKYRAQFSSHNGELYIAPLYDYAIKSSKKVLICNAPNTKIFGTPDEACHTFSITYNHLLGENGALAHQRNTYVIDIDLTICNKPSINGDYSTCTPIDAVCNKLARLDEKGDYIILYTARNVNSFCGNIGLVNAHTLPVIFKWLNEYNIPFDEIHVGKPWGNNVLYVDDKMVSIDSFLDI